MTRLGVIGSSPGNGHPFSYSAIINGYSDKGFAASGWPVIHAYLRRRRPEEFGLGDARVTHAWTQDPEITSRLCRAARIERTVDRPEAMIGEIDALLLARDDFERHLEMALPFLEADLPVFVDKPLSLEPAEIARFEPFLRSGRLMSCSALRWARELDPVREQWATYGEPLLLRAAVVNDWPRYGVHMLDAAFGLTAARPLTVQSLPAHHESMAVALDDGSLLQIDALGDTETIFRLDVVGRRRISSHDLRDNFSAFRRCLERFLRLVRTGEAPYPPEDTLRSMATLVAGRRSQREGRPVTVEEVLG